MGGDEFVVILTHLAAAQDAAMIAAKLIEKLNQPIQLKEQACTVGASIGIALFPDDGTVIRRHWLKKPMKPCIAPSRMEKINSGPQNFPAESKILQVLQTPSCLKRGLTASTAIYKNLRVSTYIF
jgi:hypothetical protein